MNIEDLEKKIKAFDFEFLRFINPTTKELSNKVILFSSIIIFFNLDYLEISELEISGLKVILQKNKLIIMLFLINSYYFFQYLNSIKIDLLLAKVPTEFSEISKMIDSKVNEVTSEINKIIIETQNSSKNENHEIKMEKISKKADLLFNNKAITIAEKWKKTIEDIIRYNNMNMLLHYYFPTLCYIVSILSFAELAFKILRTSAMFCC